MPMPVNIQWVSAWMELCVRLLSNHQARLQELDTILGDGDHGRNIVTGFAAAEQKLAGIEMQSPRHGLRVVSYTLLAAVGGASGPLYGTAFLRGAKAVSQDSSVLTPAEAGMFVVKAAEGIQERGGAQPGQKTLLDAWFPAATAAAGAVAEGASAEQVLRAAADAAQIGAEDTVSMTAVQGRAALLGSQSLGHEDPGARSSALILEAAARAAGA